MLLKKSVRRFWWRNVILRNKYNVMMNVKTFIGAKFAMSMRLTMSIDCIIITMSSTNDLIIIYHNPDNITETISIKIANQVYDNIHCV